MLLRRRNLIKEVKQATVMRSELKKKQCNEVANMHTKQQIMRLVVLHLRPIKLRTQRMEGMTIAEILRNMSPINRIP